MTTATKKVMLAAAVAMCLLVAACHPSSTGQHPFALTPGAGVPVAPIANV